LSIIDSIVGGIGTFPEAKIGPVKRMPKRGMDFCGLHAPILDSTGMIRTDGSPHIEI